MVSTLILDVSTTVSFLLKDELSPSAIKTLKALRSIPIVFVPSHFWIQLTNALLMTERRNRAPLSEISEAFNLAFALPLLTDEETARRCPAETLSLARRFKLTIYDAAYLELALRRNATLATVDKDLARAAKSAGVELLV